MKAGVLMKKRLSLIILVAGAVIGSVYATPITNLYNTGVASNGTNGLPQTLTADAAKDAHYTLTSAPSGTIMTGPYVTTQGVFPFPPWMA